MKNARIHEALCHIFNVTEAPYPWALEHGPHTGWDVAITEWNLPDPQPTQEELDEVYAQLATNEAIATVETSFVPREDELKSLMATAMLSGDDGGSKMADLRLRWSSLASEKNAAIEAALLGV